MEMPILRPIPRRTFEITPASSSESSKPSSPVAEAPNPGLLTTRSNEQSPPSRTRSILNLTSSTLLGIYSGAVDGSRQEINTPWGTGAQTPVHRRSLDGTRLVIPPFAFESNRTRPINLHKVPRKGFRQYYLPLFFQTVMLFGCGMGFGSLITHLHETKQIMPVPVPTGNSQSYQIAWGILGVILGNALPQIDSLFDADDDEAIANGYTSPTTPYQHIRTLSNSSRGEKDRLSPTDNGLGPIWYSTVRSVGAFVGIAFALRKVPWQSTLQVSLTLAVANPVLWYLIDRSKPGFALSLIVSICGTFLSLLFNPQFVPVPGIYHDQASEKLGVYVWLASILFCTSLCFGAIGRRLQL